MIADSLEKMSQSCGWHKKRPHFLVQFEVSLLQLTTMMMLRFLRKREPLLCS